MTVTAIDRVAEIQQMIGALSGTPAPTGDFQAALAAAQGPSASAPVGAATGAATPFAAEIEAAAELGVRFQPCRGSMDRGQSQGGLPPDEVVEDLDTILAETEAAIDRYHDDSFGSMLRIAVAPCTLFTASRELMVESAELARRRGVRLRSHLAETVQ